MSRLKRYFVIQCFSILLGFSFLLAGCTSMQVNHSQPVRLVSPQRIAVFPFTNMTETPQADERAASILTNLLRTRGLWYVTNYPVRPVRPTLIPGVRQPIPRPKLLAWARRYGYAYAFSGSVSEWNYKVGLDGEPAVGVNLELIDVCTGQVIWSAVGSKSGGSRTALSDVAITLIDTMLNSIHFYTVR